MILDQPYLQYKCELVAAGLLDNPDAPGTLFDRRTLLHEYRSRFDGLKPTSKSNLPLGTTGFSCGCRASGEIYLINATAQNKLHICRPPSALGSRLMKTWSIMFPVGPESVVMHPPLDLIVTTDNLYVHEFGVVMRGV